MFSDNLVSTDLFHNHFPFLTSKVSLMPAWEWALPSPLVYIGGLGDSSQDGKNCKVNRISAGQKQLHLSVLFAVSLTTAKRARISLCTETIKESLKAGAMAGVTTEQSMMSLNICMPSLQTTPLGTQFTQHMSIAALTQQMDHHMAFSPRPPSFFHPYNSPQPSKNSLLMHNLLTPPPNNFYTEKEGTTGPLPNASTMLMKGIMHAYSTALATSNTRSAVHAKQLSITSKFDRPIPNPKAFTAAPKPYCPNLTPLPSALHPHCLAKDCLQLWCPLKSCSDHSGGIHISDANLTRILEVINMSWAKGTRDVYGAGLLAFHIFCDI